MITTSIVLLYILGFLISTTLAMAWFFTSFPMHIPFVAGWRKSRVQDKDLGEWLSSLRARSALLAELLGCPICFGFWTSSLVASVIAAVNDLTVWFVVSGAFSWPAMIFVTFRLLSK